jgi:endonuclease YncB( thermonuclease family)
MRCLALALLLCGTPAFAADLAGRGSVIDGDTIEITGQRVRFNGIDAPESRQLCQNASGKDYRCGADAANALSAWLDRSQPVRCEAQGRDRYKRIIATCFRADGANVQSWLVQNGHALDWPRYSKGAYAEDQTAAEAANSGVWAGNFTVPWEWRKRKRN